MRTDPRRSAAFVAGDVRELLARVVQSEEDDRALEVRACRGALRRKAGITFQVF